MTDRHVYKRSEQYRDRHFEIPNVQEDRWIWKGRRWVKDQYFYMVGALWMDGGQYFYSEWNESAREQLTDTVCNIRSQGE